MITNFYVKEFTNISLMSFPVQIFQFTTKEKNTYI